MQKLAPTQEKCNPQETCSCPVHHAIGQARARLHDMGFDPRCARGLFLAELSVLLARLDSGLPATRESFEGLLAVGGVAGTHGVAA